MTILYDLYFAQPAGNSKFHGGGEYIKTIFFELIKHIDSKHLLTVYYNSKLFIDDSIIQAIESNPFIRVLDVSSLEEIEKIINSNEYDIFFSGLPYSYSKLSMNAKTIKIGTVHGFREIELPYDRFLYMYEDSVKKYIYKYGKYYYERCRKNQKILEYEKCMSSFDIVITDSQHSLYSYKNYLAPSNTMIKVLYPPLKQCTSSVSVLNNRQTKDIKQILMISTNRWEKNAYRAICAIDTLITEGRLNNYIVNMIGGISKSIIKSIKNKDKFISYPYVDGKVLEQMYSECDFFLYPTLNEGFGYPPLEAMRYGKTCVISNVCSLQEVYGESAYYFNPYNIYEIRNRILMAVDKKIPQGIISGHLEKIEKKQSEDTKELI